MARKAAGRRAKADKASAGRRRAGRPARAADQGGGGGGGERSDYKQKVQARKMAEADKKGGCVPKLFMLLLPFAAVGIYLALRA